MIKTTMEEIKDFYDQKVAELDQELIFLKGKKEAWEEASARIDNAIFISKVGKPKED